MGGLCLLWVALAAVAPGQGAVSRGVTATPPIRDVTAPYRVPTAPMELTGPPSATVGNTSVTPGHGLVRLSGGRSQCEGRVELEQGGVWGTVCDDGWDVTDGDVVCRQLRCGWAVRVLANSAFGRGTGPILRDDVGCEGHEQHLGDCPATLDHDCSHKEDAGVVCSEHQEWRLTGGMDGCAGRVEVFYRGTWSTVCDNAWYAVEADVLCHSLGCGVSLSRPSFAHTLPTRMLYQCGGHQPSLAHCHWVYNKSAPCYQSQAAGAVCNGSQGLQTPTPTATVTTSNVTLLSTEVSPGTGTLSAQHTLLFVLCLVLAALLLLTVLAFTAALLRVRKRSAHAVSPLGLAVPVLVTHSAQSPDVPSATPNDYREMPPSLPKGPGRSDPAVTAHPTTKDSSSDSDYEHYDFSSKPPVALSTFYNSLRRQPGDPLLPRKDGMEPFPAKVLGPPSCGSSSTSSFSSSEPYCNETGPPPHPCPSPPSHGTHQHTAPTAHDCTSTVLPAAASVPAPVLSPPVPPAEPDPTDSSSTSSGEWYENVQGMEPPGDLSPNPALPDGLCPPQGGQSPPVPRGDTHRTPTPLRAATTMTSKALPTEAARDRGTQQGDLTLCDRGHAIPLLTSPLDFLATSSVRGCGDRSW
ncbi:T-cell differentiation antigen CD6 isoform X1 [Columba livia]|uniref:T-cell differentiation antigen CD6 isoform X1 n=1 Tax=Columba livia TaxID=8932 RepID=UPI000A3A8B1B|nr:T-cell differentiation antigen CD6 isoform X3 [Columba livia]